MVKISIIIPVYNGEEYILNCINNILQQTYNNIEIIVVNDGSTDSTKEVLKGIDKRDNRIKIINKENTGVSDSRNVGINVSTGDYIAFLDSDDKLVKNAIEELVKNLNENFVDVILFGFSVIGDKKRKNDTELLNALKEKNNDNLKYELISSMISTNKNLFGYAWRALYSRSFLITNDINFPVNIKISEDYMFLLKSLYKANKIKIDTNEYYEYILGNTSMSKKYIPTLLNDMLYVNNWMYDEIISKYKELKPGYYCCMCNTYIRFIQNNLRSNNTFFYNIRLIYKNRKVFKNSISKVWYKKKLFDKKTFFGLILCRFYLEFFYCIIFILKNNFYDRGKSDVKTEKIN